MLYDTMPPTHSSANQICTVASTHPGNVFFHIPCRPPAAALKIMHNELTTFPLPPSFENRLQNWINSPLSIWSGLKLMIKFEQRKNCIYNSHSNTKKTHKARFLMLTAFSVGLWHPSFSVYCRSYSRGH